MQLSNIFSCSSGCTTRELCWLRHRRSISVAGICIPPCAPSVLPAFAPQFCATQHVIPFLSSPLPPPPLARAPLAQFCCPLFILAAAPQSPPLQQYRCQTHSTPPLRPYVPCLPPLAVSAMYLCSTVHLSSSCKHHIFLLVVNRLQWRWEAGTGACTGGWHIKCPGTAAAHAPSARAHE